MPCIQYDNLRFTDQSMVRIKQANIILSEYTAMGTDCTLRQLYYRFVARNWIPNNFREYKKLQDLINNGRMAGYIDWDVLVDRTRFLRGLPHQTSPEQMIKDSPSGYWLDKWQDQDTYLECWVEKDALIGLLEMICLTYDVPYMACRGYASASEIWRAATSRLLPQLQNGKRCVVLYLGDHDPSGLDMTRDLYERLRVFTSFEFPKSMLEVRRLALNKDQVDQYEPPANPTKSKDVRTPEYESEFGEECWELDALEPLVIREIIEKAILEYRDQEQWDKTVAVETKHRKQLQTVGENWGKAVKAASKKPKKRKPRKRRK